MVEIETHQESDPDTEISVKEGDVGLGRSGEDSRLATAVKVPLPVAVMKKLSLICHASFTNVIPFTF